MEAATAEQEKPATEVADEPAAKTPAQLFRFSTWVHVGPGAEECDEREEGCGNPLHFHAWCRLSNQFQHREIREKALAAKARKSRQLRDAETDAYTILEDDLDMLATRGEAAKDEVVEELLQPDWWKDFLDAQTAVRDREDEHGALLFERIEHDQSRLAELERLPEEERPKDEHEELVRHLDRYGEELRKAHEAIVEPKREALKQRDVNALVDELRMSRINAASMQEFTHTYASWQWFVGTLARPAGERRFTAYEDLEQAAPEVIAALQEAFNDLERTQQAATSGNS